MVRIPSLDIILEHSYNKMCLHSDLLIENMDGARITSNSCAAIVPSKLSACTPMTGFAQTRCGLFVIYSDLK